MTAAVSLSKGSGEILERSVDLLLKPLPTIRNLHRFVHISFDYCDHYLIVRHPSSLR